MTTDTAPGGAADERPDGTVQMDAERITGRPGIPG